MVGVSRGVKNTRLTASRFTDAVLRILPAPSGRKLHIFIFLAIRKYKWPFRYFRFRSSLLYHKRHFPRSFIPIGTLNGHTGWSGVDSASAHRVVRIFHQRQVPHLHSDIRDDPFSRINILPIHHHRGVIDIGRLDPSGIQGKILVYQIGKAV